MSHLAPEPEFEQAYKGEMAPLGNILACDLI
jgi:hypothetical protein